MGIMQKTGLQQEGTCEGRRNHITQGLVESGDEQHKSPTHIKGENTGATDLFC